MGKIILVYSLFLLMLVSVVSVGSFFDFEYFTGNAVSSGSVQEQINQLRAENNQLKQEINNLKAKLEITSANFKILNNNFGLGLKGLSSSSAFNKGAGSKGDVTSANSYAGGLGAVSNDGENGGQCTGSSCSAGLGEGGGDMPDCTPEECPEQWPDDAESKEDDLRSNAYAKQSSASYGSKATSISNNAYSSSTGSSAKKFSLFGLFKK